MEQTSTYDRQFFFRVLMWKANLISTGFNKVINRIQTRLSIMSMDEPFRCNLCDGLEFGSREELDKHTREKHFTAAL